MEVTVNSLSNWLKTSQISLKMSQRQEYTKMRACKKKDSIEKTDPVVNFVINPVF